ncbi:MAG: VOC family protein [Thermodesulfobacteriota bacterium]
MNVLAAHAKRLLVGFTCAIGFLALFAILVAYNSEAESSNYTRSAVDDYPLTIAIPTASPQETIQFYQKLGFKTSAGFSGGFDVVSMEKLGSPYKLEICHNKFSTAGRVDGGVSGMSFPVTSLPQAVETLQAKGLSFIETSAERDGVTYASLSDPNGISIKLFQR